MAKTKRTRKKAEAAEQDGVYFLKIVLYLILGSLWVKISKGSSTQIPIPVGAVIGALFASHEHFQIDRKIEYAMLLIAMFVAFWLPIGIFVYT